MRHEDWPARLTQYVDAHRATPFGWGSHDCVLFAAGWVAAATGVDPIGDIRDQWTDERSALRLIKLVGGLRFAVDERLGNPVSAILAQRGDLILQEITERPGLGVCLGAEFAAPHAEVGLMFVPMSAARMAWRV